MRWRSPDLGRDDGADAHLATVGRDHSGRAAALAVDVARTGGGVFARAVGPPGDRADAGRGAPTGGDTPVDAGPRAWRRRVGAGRPGNGRAGRDRLGRGHVGSAAL